MKLDVDSDDRMIDALSALRDARRIRHLKGMNKSDLAYRAYVTTMFGLFGFFLALGVVDEAPIGQGTVDWLIEHGSQWVGLGAAVVFASAVRSGANGGPLTIDDIDAHHLLLSPLGRGVVLRRPTRKLFLSAAGGGVVIGAAAGELAARRMPGTTFEWVAASAGAGALTGLMAVGAALVVSGNRKRGPLVTTAWMVLVGWSVADVWFALDTSPFSVLGHIALWPLSGQLWHLAVVVAVLALAAVGHRAVSGVSVERIKRRAALIRQIRFALSQQDLRSLILLRRQLAFEAPRRRPLMRVGSGRVMRRFPVFTRDLRSYLRWPTRRLTRVSGLSVAIGLTIAGMWHGTTVLIAAAGVLMYLIGLEVVEPFGQELDHPSIMETTPLETGRVLVEHLIGAAIAMVPIWLIATLAAFAASGSVELLVSMLAALIPASMLSAGAGAMSIQRIGSSDSAMVVPPELAGPQVLLKLVWPPALTTLAVVPILIGRQAERAGDPVLPASLNAGLFVAIAGSLVFAWIRFRDGIFDAAAVAQKEKKS